MRPPTNDNPTLLTIPTEGQTCCECGRVMTCTLVKDIGWVCGDCISWPYCDECRSFHHRKNPTCLLVQPKPWHDMANKACRWAMGGTRCDCPIPKDQGLLTPQQEQKLAEILGSRFPNLHGIPEAVSYNPFEGAPRGIARSTTAAPDLLTTQAAINRIHNMQAETAAALDKIGTELEKSIPTDPTPFGAMAQLFGAATTVLQHIQQPYTTPDALWKLILQWFGTRGDEFCHKVLGIILQYYSGHPDRESWGAAQKAYEDLLGTGFDGLNIGTLRESVQRHAKGKAAEDAERILIENYYSHLKNR